MKQALAYPRLTAALKSEFSFINVLTRTAIDLEQVLDKVVFGRCGTDYRYVSLGDDR